MKKCILVCAIMCTAAITMAQNSENEEAISYQSFYVEVGGPGVLFSANIDSRFKKERLGWGIRGGLGFVTANEYVPNGNNGNYERRSIITVPVQINYLFGKKNSPHIFEVGGGATYLSKKLDILDFYDDERTQLLGTASFMYRKQPVEGGFTWRIGFTPVFSKGYIQPFGGVSIGYAF